MKRATNRGIKNLTGRGDQLTFEFSMAPAAASSFGTSGEDWEDGESEEDEVIEFHTSNMRFFHDC